MGVGSAVFVAGPHQELVAGCRPLTLTLKTEPYTARMSRCFSGIGDGPTGYGIDLKQKFFFFLSR